MNRRKKNCKRQLREFAKIKGPTGILTEALEDIRKKYPTYFDECVRNIVEKPEVPK